MAYKFFDTPGVIIWLGMGFLYKRGRGVNRAVPVPWRTGKLYLRLKAQFCGIGAEVTEHFCGVFLFRIVLNIGLGIDKWIFIPYLCCMSTKKERNIADNLKLTRYIETQRVGRKIKLSELCVVMGISVDTYKRRLESEDGFTEREIHLAAGELGIDVRAEVRL